MVLKPSEFTPYSAFALAELARRAGLPKGVLNLVTGDAAPIGQALTQSPIVKKITFTGSTRVGKLLLKQCADTVKRTSMELGGNAPFIVSVVRARGDRAAKQHEAEERANICCVRHSHSLLFILRFASLSLLFVSSSGSMMPTSKLL